MPALTKSIADARTLIDLAMTERTPRMVDISTYWDYYEGRHKKWLKVREGEPDYNVIINLCARVVNQSVNFMVGSLPQFEIQRVQGQTSEKDDVAEALVAQWMDENDFEDFVNDLMTMAAVSGHAIVKLIHEPEKLNVRPVVLDPSLVTIYWSPEDKSKVLAYMILWQISSDRQMREDHIYIRESNAWEVVQYEGFGSDWVEISRMAWPYPFAQLVDWKNLPNPRGYYGRSDIETAMALNDAYNFRVSNTSKILWVHAHPRTLAFGVDKNGISGTAIDGLWLVPDVNARIENLEMTSDLESSRMNAHEVKSDLFSDAETVDLSSVKDKAGQLTNFGLRLMFAEALAKNAKKRRLAGRGLVEMMRRVGALLGQNWESIKIVWADPLPENMVERVSIAKESIAMGVTSRQTESERLGNDWERERERMAEERAESALNLGQSIADSLRDQTEEDED